jgi:hypothetical protein
MLASIIVASVTIRTFDGFHNIARLAYTSTCEREDHNSCAVQPAAAEPVVAMSNPQFKKTLGSVGCHEPFQLLQLPGAALDRVLQKLDPFSLASTAASCSKLSRAVPARTQLSVQCRDQETLNTLNMWLQDSTSLASITQISLNAQVWARHGPDEPQVSVPWHPTHVRQLPCAGLRHLQLNNLEVQLEQADGCPGVLHECTGLTALGPGGVLGQMCLQPLQPLQHCQSSSICV